MLRHGGVQCSTVQSNTSKTVNGHKLTTVSAFSQLGKCRGSHQNIQPLIEDGGLSSTLVPPAVASVTTALRPPLAASLLLLLLLLQLLLLLLQCT
jgi:hypothetical protein